MVTVLVSFTVVPDDNIPSHIIAGPQSGAWSQVRHNRHILHFDLFFFYPVTFRVLIFHGKYLTHDSCVPIALYVMRVMLNHINFY